MDGDSIPQWAFRVIYVLTWLLIPHVLFRKKNPASAMAWIWAILLFPIVGAVLYLGFGTNRITRKYLRRKALARLGAERDHCPTPAPESITDGDAQRRFDMLERMTGKKLATG